MVILREIPGTKKAQMPFSFEATRSGEMQEWAGIAVDIGTTTIAAYLWDFGRGELSMTLSEENCQTVLGTDVMMRIMHSVRGKGQALHKMLVEQIEKMCERMITAWSDGVPVPDDKIKMSVVGNPAMCHFFLGKDVSGLAGAPFLGAYTGNYSCSGGDVGFVRRKRIGITVLSGIAAHVGGDALAMYGAVEKQGDTGTRLLVDLGTNAEIILIRRGKIYCCSTAAGPALEGKGISCGMRAGAGAVTGVKIAKKTGNIVLAHLPGKMPAGLTGTGVLELIEQLRRCGILTVDGYLKRQEEILELGISPALSGCVVKKDEKWGFQVYRGKKEIILFQEDIRNIQLAKGAILAGIQCMLDSCGLSDGDVDDVAVAGAFGSSLQEETAVRLGVFPAGFRGKISFVGNAAGQGAVKMLLDPGFAARMEARAGDMVHVELAEKETFKKYLLQGMELREYPE